MSTSPLIFDPYIVGNIQGESFLDIGCGHGKWGYLLRKYADPSLPRRYIAGVDLFEPHVQQLVREGIYDDVRLGDACNLPFDDKSFDSVIACEVLEHLPEHKGENLLIELKRVARQCIVVSTPNFPCLRGGGETLDGFNPYEAHKHIYSYSEFAALGFTQIMGVGNLKIRPWKAAVALGSLGLYFPWFSRYLLGYWFADGRKRNLAVE